MTKRAGDLSQIWASDGEVTDPDLDTEHPIFQVGKYLIGWVVEREPHQWQNYLNQITDLKMQIFASEQFAAWEPTVPYADNAVVRHEDVIYTNDSGRTSLDEMPDASSSTWRTLLGTDAESISTATANLTKQLADHSAADNPHNDNIHDIGGYESGEIDDFLNSPTDSRTIVYHKNQKGAVHDETPFQVGTLPESGGAFAGDVKFIGGISLIDGSVDQDGPDQLIGNSKGALHLTTAGIATGSDKSEIITEANFADKQMAVNNEFALPPPLLFADVRKSLNGMGVGSFSLNNPSEPVFEEAGLLLSSANEMTGDGMDFGVLPTTSYFVGFDGTNEVRGFHTSDESDYRNIGSYVASSFPTWTHIKYFLIYPKLTNYQKTKLVN